MSFNQNDPLKSLPSRGQSEPTTGWGGSVFAGACSETASGSSTETDAEESQESSEITTEDLELGRVKENLLPLKCCWKKLQAEDFGNSLAQS
jgi:hypothetical protein